MGLKKNKRSKERNKRNSTFSDPMSVTWLEKYDKTVSKTWNKLPQSVGNVLVTVATFVVGISINGDWLSVIVHAGKQFGYIDSGKSTTPWTSFDLLFKDFWTFWISSCITSYTLYFGIGGFLHWYYYVRQRDRAEEWKCQPTKWLSPELELHEIVLGSISLFLNATLGGAMACYVANGGYSMIYYGFSDYGWAWFIIQLPVIYLIMFVALRLTEECSINKFEKKFKFLLLQELHIRLDQNPDGHELKLDFDLLSIKSWATCWKFHSKPY